MLEIILQAPDPSGKKGTCRPALQQVTAIQNKRISVLIKMPARHIQPGLPGRCEQPAMDITGKQNPKCSLLHILTFAETPS